MKINHIHFNNHKYDFCKDISLNIFKGKNVWFFESPELNIVDYIAIFDAPHKKDVFEEFAKHLHSLISTYKDTDDFLLSEESYDKKFRLITYVKNF